MKQLTGRLENWVINYYGIDEFTISGELFEDVNNRWVVGARVRTSGIKTRRVRVGDTVQTRNSRYLLGKRL